MHFDVWLENRRLLCTHKFHQKFIQQNISVFIMELTHTSFITITICTYVLHDNLIRYVLYNQWSLEFNILYYINIFVSPIMLHINFNAAKLRILKVQLSNNLNPIINTYLENFS